MKLYAALLLCFLSTLGAKEVTSEGGLGNSAFLPPTNNHLEEFEEKVGEEVEEDLGETDKKVLVLCPDMDSLREKKWLKILGGSFNSTEVAKGSKESLEEKKWRNSEVYGVGVGLDSTDHAHILELEIGSKNWLEKMKEEYAFELFDAIIEEQCPVPLASQYSAIYDKFLKKGGFWYMSEFNLDAYKPKKESQKKVYESTWGIDASTKQCKRGKNGCSKFEDNESPHRCRCDVLLEFCGYEGNEPFVFKFEEDNEYVHQLVNDAKKDCGLKIKNFNELFVSYIIAKKSTS